MLISWGQGILRGEAGGDYHGGEEADYDEEVGCFEEVRKGCMWKVLVEQHGDVSFLPSDVCGD